MTESAALLPSGLRDTLPPEAEHEAEVTASLLATFRQNGYRQVSPPLVEFEASLLTGAGAAMTDKTFRLVDPASQRTLAVRADMTPANLPHRRNTAEPLAPAAAPILQRHGSAGHW